MKHYDDILHLPHPVSKKHRQMPIADRAAQFMPFAALTGYEAALAETARLTSPRIEPDDAQRELLNRQLCFLQSLAAEADSAGAYPESRVSCVLSDSDMQAASAKVQPNAQAAFAFPKNTRTASSRVSEPARSLQEEQLSITVTYFCPDTKKEGGIYRTVSGRFLKVDVYAQLLWLEVTEDIPTNSAPLSAALSADTTAASADMRESVCSERERVHASKIPLPAIPRANARYAVRLSVPLPDLLHIGGACFAAQQFSSI